MLHAWIGSVGEADIGFGDELLGSGIAKAVRAKTGKRTAFGDGHQIIWHNSAHEVYRGNPNVVPPGEETGDVEWVRHYQGFRLYAKNSGNRWMFDPSFRAQRGEIYFDGRETDLANSIKGGFVVIEPTVKPLSPNKQWPFERYVAVAESLTMAGYDVVQLVGIPLPEPRVPPITDEARAKWVAKQRAKAFNNNPWRIPQKRENIPDVARQIKTRSFREALAVLSRAALYVGPEGGLHHGAAALNVPAVVIFGGYISPRTTGYDDHVNIFTGDVACGRMQPCEHCKEAMSRITADQVFRSAMGILEPRVAVNL